MPATDDSAVDLGSRLVVDPGEAWRLNPRVAVRPEPFGALLYHFGTRQLSFLKDVQLVDLVTVLADFGSVEEAFAALDIDEARQPRYLPALQRLADTDMLLPAAVEAPDHTTQPTSMANEAATSASPSRGEESAP